MRLLSWFITTPIALCIVLFALANNHDVSLYVFLQDIEVLMPLYLIALTPFFVGFVLGGIISWWSQGVHRRKVKSLQKELKTLEKAQDKKWRDGAKSISEIQKADPDLRLIEQK